MSTPAAWVSADCTTGEQTVAAPTAEQLAELANVPKIPQAPTLADRIATGVAAALTAAGVTTQVPQATITAAVTSAIGADVPGPLGSFEPTAAA